METTQNEAAAERKSFREFSDALSGRYAGFGALGPFAHKMTTFFLLISFTLLNTSNQVFAEVLEAGFSRHDVIPADPIQILGSLSLPEERGSIQDIFISKGIHPERLIIYLQDTH